MEDSEGVLNFDFEGGLDAPPSAATASVAAAPSGPIVPSESSFPSTVASNGGAAPPSVNDHAAVNVPGRRSFRQTVCRHWLRSLCMKGDACGFLHQYDKARMPVCRFFRLYGECREQDCVYKHTNEDIKECNMYVCVYICAPSDLGCELCDDRFSVLFRFPLLKLCFDCMYISVLCY